jgi:hypothetical protein
VLYCGDLPKSSAIEPVPAEPGRLNWFGSRKTEPIAQAADGTILLPASRAALHGEFLFYEKTKAKDNLGRWISPNDWASWSLAIAKPGEYSATATYGSGSSDGRTFEVSAGSARLIHRVQKTKGMDEAADFELGTVVFPQKGPATLSVKPVDSPKGLLINLRSIRLEPKKQ